MKRILITGKGSYIGTSFERYAGSRYPGEFEIHTLDMKDSLWREKSFSGYDAVFHVAGIAHADVGDATEEDKQRYYEVNTRLALDTAAKAKGEGVAQFVFMSSMIVYGAREKVTLDMVPAPENFYGDSKWQADKGIRELSEEGFQVAVLRPPMVYGPGSRGNYPKLAGMAKRLPLFPDVKNRRSMLYIENLCEFLCHIIREGRGGVFFPQNREPVSTGQLVKEIAKCAGHRIWVTSLLAPGAALGKHMPGKIGSLCRKAFGSCYYEAGMGETGWDYQVAGWSESVRRTEAGSQTAEGGCLAPAESAGSRITSEKTDGCGVVGTDAVRENGSAVGADAVQENGQVARWHPLMSITTATYNSEKTLARTIESVLNQTYDNIEYIIVDGLSQDRTLEVAESYRERFAERGFSYKIVSEPDAGMYDAINKGIRLSRGEIIGNINSDDWYEPEAVERAVNYMAETDCEYMYADLRIIRTDGSSFVKRARRQRMATSRGWNHPTQFALRRLHEKFPYKLESLHDDFDLFLKVRRAGCRIGVLNQVLANFTLQGMSHDKSLRAAAARGRCRYRIYRNNGYGPWYMLECIMIEAAKLVLG